MSEGSYDQVVELGRYVQSKTRKEKFWYDEEKLVNELRDYIGKTYEEHYVGNKIQSFDAIIESGNGPGFFMGNVQKYAWRYGKKNGFNRLDLLKILHYGILTLFCHDHNVRDVTAGESSDGSRPKN